MDTPGTIFCLIPQNGIANIIVNDAANRSRLCVDPGVDRPFLRIAFDQDRRYPSQLVRLGRTGSDDVNVPLDALTRDGHCSFSLHKETGELLFRDSYPKLMTNITPHRPGQDNAQSSTGFTSLSLLSKYSRMCSVVLAPHLDHSERHYTFTLAKARFLLVPGRTPGGDAARRRLRLAISHMPDPGDTVTDEQAWIDQLGRQLAPTVQTCDSASTVAVNHHNTRFKTPLQPAEKDEIVAEKVEFLGGGGQGEVYKVVDVRSGRHFACKFITVDDDIPELAITSKKAFRMKVEGEVNLVRSLQHDHIVPYVHTQGFTCDDTIQLYMPLYDNNLLEITNNERHKIMRDGADAVSASLANIVWTMMPQMLEVLDHLQKGPAGLFQPQGGQASGGQKPVTHGDIKPDNILYKDGKFYLGDFGIAKFAGGPNRRLGTPAYAAPEVCEHGALTPKADIYSLAVTMLNCLDLEAQNRLFGVRPHRTHEYYYNRMAAISPNLLPMLALDPNDRPSARAILDSGLLPPPRGPLPMQGEGQGLWLTMKDGHLQVEEPSNNQANYAVSYPLFPSPSNDQPSHPATVHYPREMEIDPPSPTPNQGGGLLSLSELCEGLGCDSDRNLRDALASRTRTQRAASVRSGHSAHSRASGVTTRSQTAGVRKRPARLPRYR